MNSEVLLSICITSYNRVHELKRCLETITIKDKSKVEIIISEDHSPKAEEIKNMVDEFSNNSVYRVIFNSNEINLGYDNNLHKLISLANGKYIFFMSDDDVFIKGSLNKVVNLLENNEYACIFSPFKDKCGDIKRRYKNSFYIEKGIKNSGKNIYNAILFSGLIFRREYVSMIPASRFLNFNYFQVYLFMHVINQYGAYYFNVLTVYAIEDGENAYGVAASSVKNDLLANRKSVLSNLEFHKGLIKTIKLFDHDNNSNVFKIFQKEYSLHSYTGMRSARLVGKKELRQFWRKMRSLDIKISPIAYVYFFMLITFGVKIADNILLIPKKTLRYLRKSGDVNWNIAVQE